MPSEHFLVTGAYGCIGSWVVRQLVLEGAAVTAFDIAADGHRWNIVMTPEERAEVRRVTGDISDLTAVEQAIEGGATHVIHLAALQIPFCRADPPQGALTNVVGTVNVFEAVKRRSDTIRQVVYASSIAAYDAIEAGDAEPGMSRVPDTLYGVFKRANEGTAHVYWHEHRLPSIGLRPHTVYGPGRDQGMTSEPTVAMLAAAAGQSHRIPFGGRVQMQYAPDAAAAFIAAARASVEGAGVHNLGGEVIHMSEIAATIARVADTPEVTVTFDEVQLPFPDEVDAESLTAAVGSLPETAFADGVADTIARFRPLLAAGVVSTPTRP